MSVVCDLCGESNIEGAVECSNCGEDLSVSHTTVAVQAVTEVESVPEPVPVVVPEVSLPVMVGARLVTTITYPDNFRKFVKAMISPDGRVLAASTVKEYKIGHNTIHDGNVSFWDVPSGKMTSTIRDFPDYLWAIAFSPDGRFVAVGGLEKTVWVTKISSGKVVASLQVSGYVMSLDFSPNGEILVAGLYDENVLFWDVSNGTTMGPMMDHDGSVMEVRYSPEGDLLASGSKDKTIIVWDTASGRSLKRLVGHGDSISRLAFLPGRENLVSSSSDGTVRLWDIASGQCKSTWKGSLMALSVDGSKLAVLGSGGNIDLYNVANGQLVTTVKSSTDSAGSLGFSRDGKVLIAESSKSTKVWEILEN